MVRITIMASEERSGSLRRPGLTLSLRLEKVSAASAQIRPAWGGTPSVRARTGLRLIAARLVVSVACESRRPDCAKGRSAPNHRVCTAGRARASGVRRYGRRRVARRRPWYAGAFTNCPTLTDRASALPDRSRCAPPRRRNGPNGCVIDSRPACDGPAPRWPCSPWRFSSPSSSACGRARG